MNISELKKYVEIGLRRKQWFIIPFLLTALLGSLYAATAPKVYEAETLILVQPQKVPQNFVRPIVSIDIDDRLRTITQQVTSRTNLEKIIQEYHLYDRGHERNLLIDEKVELFRKKIKIDVVLRGGNGGNAFSISFRGQNPVTVKEVTNALASNFISENIKIRESQALGTSAFLADELESMERRLSKKEQALKDYRHRYMGALPDQLQTNLAMLERLQMQMEQLNFNLRDGENRRLLIQNQLSQAADSTEETNRRGPVLGDGARDLLALRKELSILTTKYTLNHPDVRRLKATIAQFESKEPVSIDEHQPRTSEASETQGTEQIREDSVTLPPELQQIDIEIRNTKAEIKSVRAKIENLQQKIEDTPKREQELLSLNRDYANLKDIYDSILNRKLEAEIAVSMEKKQKGEQFRVVDPAKAPQLPVEPSIPKIIMLTVMLGMGLGAGLVYLREMTDTSYKSPDELEDDVRVPVLVAVPLLYTEKDTRKFRAKRFFIVASSVAVTFLLSIVAIVFSAKGFGGAIDQFKAILANI